MRFLYEIADAEGPLAYVVHEAGVGTRLVVPNRPDLAELITGESNREYGPADGCPHAHLANTAAHWLGAEARPVDPFPGPPYDPDVQY